MNLTRDRGALGLALLLLVWVVLSGAAVAWASEVREYARPGTRILGHQYVAPLDITVDAWQTQPPALFPALSVAPGPEEVSTGPLRVAFSHNGLPLRVEYDRFRRDTFGPESRMLSGISFLVEVESADGTRREVPLHLAEGESGIEVANSYFTRRLARFVTSDAASTRLDVYTELMVDSPFLYLFPRIYLDQGSSYAFTTTLELAGRYRRVTYFPGNERVQVPATESVSLQLGEGTTKPFLLFERADGGPGVVVFLPLRPEVREWYHEHYIARAVPTVHITVEPAEDGLTVTFQVEGVRASSELPHTFDFYYWVFPFQGPAAYALGLLPGGVGSRVWSPVPPFVQPDVPGFWVEHWPNEGEARTYQALRYFPAEGYSFGRPVHYYGGAYMTEPENAHSWGIQSANFKRLNLVNAITGAGFTRDLAIRHLQLYLDKADHTGIPPYRATAATWFKHFEGLSGLELLNNFHFAQAPELMVKTAANFIATGTASPEDQQHIASVFNRMLVFLDPENESMISNTHVMPDGSYWYNYFEMETQRIQEGLMDEPGFVNNVHVTWLNIAADAARLNKALGNKDAYEAWVNYFRKGVDGMIYLFSQERAWTEHDPNELRYGISWPGPNTDYAHLLLTGWLPRVMEFAYEEVGGYRVEEQLCLFQRIMQGRWTSQGRHMAARSAAEQWLNAFPGRTESSTCPWIGE